MCAETIKKPKSFSIFSIEKSFSPPDLPEGIVLSIAHFATENTVS